MSNSILISGATIVNEGRLTVADVLIEDGWIKEIASDISPAGCQLVNARGKYLLPGIIDTHVHFREPGLAIKGDIRSESAAAVAGGVTSYFDMPNTLPNATTFAEVARKCRIAEKTSFANYAFYLGATKDTLTLLPSAEMRGICGLTDDGLYFTSAKSLLVDQPELFADLLSKSDKIISIHSEYEAIVEANLERAVRMYGDDIPVRSHPVIRNEEACYLATEAAIRIARKTSGRLHVLHLSTARESQLFAANSDVKTKKITAEVCVHHLWFCDDDYERLGGRIKWNPAIKTRRDKEELLRAINEGRIDVISTDHAPHLLSEKSRCYRDCPSGAPMVQHSLLIMLELVNMGKITISKVVEKMCHNPATLFGVVKRGFIRLGYHADIVLVDMQQPTVIDQSNILYKCGWSPLEGQQLSCSIYCTLVNGVVSYMNDRICSLPVGQKLSFDN